MKSVCVASALVVGLVASSASANDISGFRLEALLGWDNVKVENFGNKSGFAYGAGIGYDFGVGETLSVGLDAEIMGATTSISGSGFIDDVFVSGKVSTGRDIYVGGRLTGKVADNVALYAKAGYTNGRLSAEADIDGDEIGASGNGDGFRAGVGGQFLLGGGGYVGGEYRYSNYESDFVRHQVLATFGYRF